MEYSVGYIWDRTFVQFGWHSYPHDKAFHWHPLPQCKTLSCQISKSECESWFLLWIHLMGCIWISNGTLVCVTVIVQIVLFNILLEFHLDSSLYIECHQKCTCSYSQFWLKISIYSFSSSPVVWKIFKWDHLVCSMLWRCIGVHIYQHLMTSMPLSPYIVIMCSLEICDGFSPCCCHIFWALEGSNNLAINKV